MKFDCIIIGAGPAGITAGIYLGSLGVKTLIITKNIGGLLNEISTINNYPGYYEISGRDLMNKFFDHLQKFKENVSIYIDEVIKIEKQKEEFKIITSNDEEYYSLSLIVASGSKRKKLNVPGEKEFFGKGVSYCAICDGALYKNKTVAVVGGGNTALHEALVLSEICKKVYLIHRREEFRASLELQELIKSKNNIEIVVPYEVLEIKGSNRVEKISIKSKNTNEIKELLVDGVFIAIGLEPNIDFLMNLGIELTEDKRIKVNEDMSTNIKGLFAAGDITSGSNRLNQIITACSEGTIAAVSCYNYLKSIKEKE